LEVGGFFEELVEGGERERVALVIENHPADPCRVSPEHALFVGGDVLESVEQQVRAGQVHNREACGFKKRRSRDCCRGGCRPVFRTVEQDFGELAGSSPFPREQEREIDKFSQYQPAGCLGAGFQEVSFRPGPGPRAPARPPQGHAGNPVGIGSRQGFRRRRALRVPHPNGQAEQDRKPWRVPQ